MEATYLTVDFFRKLPQDGEIRPGGTGKKGGNALPEPQAMDRYGEGHYRYWSEYFHTFYIHCSLSFSMLIPYQCWLTQFDPTRPIQAEINIMPTFFRTIASNVTAYIAMVSDTLKDTIPKAVVHCQVREAKRSLFNNFYNRIADRAVQSTSHSSV